MDVASRSMRVLHVNKFLYRRGGAEAYLFDLAALQRARGDDVAYFGMAHPDNDSPQRYGQLFPPHVQLEPPPPGLAGRVAAVGRMLHSPASRRGLAEAIADFRPDVVHAHNVYHQLSPSVLRAAADAGVPCVLTMHDYKLACPSYQLLAGRATCDACVSGGPWQAVRTRCKDGSLARSAVLAAETWLHRVTGAYGPVRAFVSPSRFLADVMARAGVYPDRLRVVRHFVDGSVVAPSSAPGEGVVFAGRLVPEKGVDTLVAAAGLGGFRLDVAGEGPARPELARLADRVAPGRVTFHGRLARDDLHELMRRARVAAVPSRWHENQPMAVLEAFACGLPVVTTGLGGLPELVEPGVDGAIVPADDPAALAAALTGLLADPEVAFAMGKAGRAKVERDFAPAVHLARIREVYRGAAP